MAIIDSLLEFSDAQAVTVTAVATNVVDTGGNVDIGSGDQSLYLQIIATEAATAAGAATVTFALEHSDAVVGGALDAAEVVYQTAAIPKASLGIGTRVLRYKLPFGLKRYLGVTYTVATGPLTAGKFTAQLVKDVELQRADASGFSIVQG